MCAIFPLSLTFPVPHEHLIAGTFKKKKDYAQSMPVYILLTLRKSFFDWLLIKQTKKKEMNKGIRNINKEE